MEVTITTRWLHMLYTSKDHFSRACRTSVMLVCLLPPAYVYIYRTLTNHVQLFSPYQSGYWSLIELPALTATST